MKENHTLSYGVNHPQQPVAPHTVNKFDFFNLVGILFYLFIIIDRNSGHAIFFFNFIARNSGRTIFFKFFY